MPRQKKHPSDEDSDAEQGRQTLMSTLAEPKVKYSLIAVGALLALLVIRRLFR